MLVLIVFMVWRVHKCRDEYAILWEFKYQLLNAIAIAITYVIVGFVVPPGTKTRIVAVNYQNLVFGYSGAWISTYLVMWKFKKQQVVYMYFESHGMVIAVIFIN